MELLSREFDRQGMLLQGKDELLRRELEFNNEPTTATNAELEAAPEASRTNCCWQRIVELQSDFANEKPVLQTIIKDAGHICIFLPKYHCELNPIEMYWGYAKGDYRRKDHANARFDTAKLEVIESLEVPTPIMIQKWFNHVFRYVDGYHRWGLSGTKLEKVVKKYKSHRRIPEAYGTSLDRIT